MNFYPPRDPVDYLPFGPAFDRLMRQPRLSTLQPRVAECGDNQTVLSKFQHDYFMTVRIGTSLKR